MSGIWCKYLCFTEFLSVHCVSRCEHLYFTEFHPPLSLLCFQTLITSGENYPYLMFSSKMNMTIVMTWNYFLLKDFCKKIIFCPSFVNSVHPSWVCIFLWICSKFKITCIFINKNFIVNLWCELICLKLNLYS